MAKINVTIPQPTPLYDSNNQQQQLQALDQLKQQLNYTYQQDLKNEQDTFNFFLS